MHYSLIQQLIDYYNMILSNRGFREKMESMESREHKEYRDCQVYKALLVKRERRLVMLENKSESKCQIIRYKSPLYNKNG